MGRYEIELTNAQWHTEGFPDRDGEFWVIVGYGKRKDLTTLNFTVRHGWNSVRIASGEYVMDKAWGYDNHDGYIKAWASAPPFKVIYHEA